MTPFRMIVPLPRAIENTHRDQLHRLVIDAWEDVRAAIRIDLPLRVRIVYRGRLPPGVNTHDAMRGVVEIVGDLVHKSHHQYCSGSHSHHVGILCVEDPSADARLLSLVFEFESEVTPHG